MTATTHSGNSSAGSEHIVAAVRNLKLACLAEYFPGVEVLIEAHVHFLTWGIDKCVNWLTLDPMNWKNAAFVGPMKANRSKLEAGS